MCVEHVQMWDPMLFDAAGWPLARPPALGSPLWWLALWIRIFFWFLMGFFVKTFYFQVITQIWVLLLGGIGLAGILDVWVGLVKWPFSFFCLISFCVVVEHLQLFWRTVSFNYSSFTGRTYISNNILSCCRWILAIVHLLRSTSKGKSFFFLSLLD